MAGNIFPLKRPAQKAGPSPRIQARTHLEAALDTGVRGSLRDAIRAALDVAESPRKRDLLTTQYEALKPGQKLVDGSRPGFLARCTNRGVRFIYRHNHPETDQRIELTIGHMRDTTLAEAREAWADLRAQRMAGKVPTLLEETSGDLMSLDELIRRYLDEYASQVKRSWKDDKRLLERHILPAYGSRHADEFSTDDARALFNSLNATPRERDKLRATLSTMFNVAVGRTSKVAITETWLPSDFHNPITNAITLKHEADTYFPDPKETRTYYQRLFTVAMRDDYRGVLLLQLLTASRIQEIAGLQWAEVDLEAGTITVPESRSKNGNEHLIILSEPALAILAQRAEWRSPADVCVFPSPKNRRVPVRSDLVQTALATNREDLGLDPRFTSHNVRHAFATWAADLQVSTPVVDRCMAHVTATGINRRYNSAQLNRPAAQLWRQWAEYLHG